MKSSVLRILLLANEAVRRGALDAEVALEHLFTTWGSVTVTDSDWHGLLEGPQSDRLLMALGTHVDMAVERAAGDYRRAISELGGLHPRLLDALSTRVPDVALEVGAVRAKESSLPFMRTGRYKNFELVGVGGMGAVFRAWDQDLGRTVALKIGHPGGDSLQGGPTTPLDIRPPPPGFHAGAQFHEFKARFLQEAWIASALEHPGIIPVYELARTEHEIPYYTMRYVAGDRTLATAIAECSDVEQDMAERMALVDTFARLCDAIGFAHEHDVVHRDIKPKNVALGDAGEVIVLDWGLSRLRKSDGSTTDPWKEHIQRLSRCREFRHDSRWHGHAWLHRTGTARRPPCDRPQRCVQPRCRALRDLDLATPLSVFGAASIPQEIGGRASRGTVPTKPAGGS